MRWGQRRGIHLEALDRLLLLSTEDINDLLNNYKNPEDPNEESWLCPKCLAFNNSNLHSHAGALKCIGGSGVGDCDGMRVVPHDEAEDLPKGWSNWLGDPTMHFLLLVNQRWLEARRRVLRQERPVWEKPPDEPQGTKLTDDMIPGLEAALVTEARKGNIGLKEEDLHRIPGFEDVTLPLGEPPESSNIHRTRLPGTGSMSQWTYCLKGKERLKHTENFNAKCPILKRPVDVKTGKLPQKQVDTAEEMEKRDRKLAKVMKEYAVEEREKEEEEEKDKRQKLDEAKEKAAAEKAATSAAKPQARSQKGGAAAKWEKKESTSNPGKFYYVNAETGETVVEKPPDFDLADGWVRKESTSNPGSFYYYNASIGESRMDPPRGGAVASTSQPEAVPSKEGGVAWERRESKSKPGNFYYFHPVTGTNETEPPPVEWPWQLLESKSNKGQFYYFNQDTKENTVHPPACAKSSRKRPHDAGGLNGSNKRPPVNIPDDSLPEGWVKRTSDKYKGKYYYFNLKTQASSWLKPGSGA